MGIREPLFGPLNCISDLLQSVCGFSIMIEYDHCKIQLTTEMLCSVGTEFVHLVHTQPYALFPMEATSR